MTDKIVDKDGYDNCMKMIGKIDAIRSSIGELISIGRDDMTEEEYDENVHHAAGLLFNAGKILENSAKKYVEKL